MNCVFIQLYMYGISKGNLSKQMLWEHEAQASVFTAFFEFFLNLFPAKN